MLQPFDSSLPPHGFCPGAEFFKVGQLFRSVYPRVSGASPIYVKFQPGIQILGDACVQASIFAEYDVDEVGCQALTLRGVQFTIVISD